LVLSCPRAIDADPALWRPLEGEVSEDGGCIAGLERGGSGPVNVGGEMALRLLGISTACWLGDVG